MTPDWKTTCKVYPFRFNIRIKAGTNELKCVSANEMAICRLLPNDCPYAKEIPGYRTKVLEWQ
jgi:hypothetical protein